MASIIEYAAPIPEKPHVLHVGLRVTTPAGDVIQEVPVRKVHYYESLRTLAKRVAYAQQCAEYHHPAPGAEGQQKRLARRAAWDADDKAAADAAAAAVKADEESKWLARPVGRMKDGQVVVDVTHGGMSVQVRVPADATDPQQAIREAWQVEWDKRQAEQQELSAFRLG